MPNDTPKTQSSFSTFLQKAASALEEAAKDVLALQVLTFTGEVTAFIGAKTKKDANNQEQTVGLDVKWEEFFKQAAGISEGRLTLVAATQVEVDGDTILFVAEGAPEPLRQAHIEATQAAQQYRQELVTGLAQLVGFK